MHRNIYCILLLLLTLPAYIQAKPLTWSKHQQPDDAFCSSFSSINSTCSTCIEHGCIYCDTDGTGIGGTCYSHTSSCSQQSSYHSITTCPQTQPSHSNYQSNSVYLPIQLSVIIVMIACYGGWKWQPQYANTHTNAPHQTISSKPVIILTAQDGLEQPLVTSTLDPYVSHSQPSIITTQHFPSTIIPWEATLWYRLIVYLMIIGITCISIISILLDSWSTVMTPDTIIVYGSYGDYTLSHDITLWSHYSCDDISLTCRTHAIMMIIIRILTIWSAACLGLVMIHMSISLLCQQSISKYSFTMIYTACISHLLALVIFITGPFLIQTSVNTPNTPQLSITWEMTLLCILVNMILLLPMIWLHINSISPPHSCWNALSISNLSLDDIVVEDMTCSTPTDTACASCVGMGVSVSAPMEKMIGVTEYHTGKYE